MDGLHGKELMVSIGGVAFFVQFSWVSRTTLCSRRALTADLLMECRRAPPTAHIRAAIPAGGYLSAWQSSTEAFPLPLK